MLRKEQTRAGARMSPLNTKDSVSRARSGLSLTGNMQDEHVRQILGHNGRNVKACNAKDDVRVWAITYSVTKLPGQIVAIHTPNSYPIFGPTHVVVPPNVVQYPIVPNAAVPSLNVADKKLRDLIIGTLNVTRARRRVAVKEMREPGVASRKPMMARGSEQVGCGFRRRSDAVDGLRNADELLIKLDSRLFPPG